VNPARAAAFAAASNHLPTAVIIDVLLRRQEHDFAKASARCKPHQQDTHAPMATEPLQTDHHAHGHPHE